MIAHLTGRILETLNDSLVIGVGGVGLQVFVPAASRQNLRPGENVILHTYLVLRQDSITLYGFELKEEKELFGLLLTADGVGPKTALAVLSTLNPDAIRRAVLGDQPELLSRVPGVGKKTAQKIILHLQDRLGGMAGIGPAAGISEVDAEVLAALTSLGYSVVEAQTALQSIPRETPQEVETRLRIALQFFG